MSNVIFAKDTEYYTKSGAISRLPVIVSGFLLGTDSANDPTIGVWNNPGTKLILPTATYDASALGLNGFQGQWRYSLEGMSLVVTCAGTVYIVPQWQEWYSGSLRD